MSLYTDTKDNQLKWVSSIRMRIANFRPVRLASLILLYTCLLIFLYLSFAPTAYSEQKFYEFLLLLLFELGRADQSAVWHGQYAH
jgi:type IV secretory pathway VirB3-like protein